MKETLKISMIDDAFSTYMLEQNDDEITSKLKTILNALSKNKFFTIHIVECNEMKKDPFFGMRIFPSQKETFDTLKKLPAMQSINDLVRKWKTIACWDIEIDSRIFDRRLINFNPQEMTAMLLHEIGHTIYSDKISEVFYRAYKEASIRSTTEDRAVYKALYKLYSIPLFFACGFRNWKVDSDDMREEVFADNSVKKLGYGEYLISAYQKIIRLYGTRSCNISEHKDVVENSVLFINKNIADLEKRKEQLKDELYYIGVRNKGFWIRNILSDIIKSLGIVKKETYSGNISYESLHESEYAGESFLQDNTLFYDLKRFNDVRKTLKIATENAKMEVATEGFRKKKKNLVPSQLDVDTIFVEVDRIQSHADRRYVLDLIYHQEEKINNFLEMCENNPDMKKRYELKMQGMLRELASMRQDVLDKRSFNKEYKVFVKYPVGYEG